jgi:hypothetical protein
MATRTPSAAFYIANGFRWLARPPFATLTGIALLLWGASRSISTLEGAQIVSLFVLLIVTAYVHMAAILAAAALSEVEQTSDGSADRWIRAALARRCFWRLVFADLFSVALVLLSAMLFLIPSFFVGAAVALALPAAVLERLLPGDAVRRSFELTRGRRRTTGTIFALLIWIPLIVAQVGFGLGWDSDLGAAWLIFEGLSVILEMTAVIALTSFYVRITTT